jgi:hypothetical protein
MYVGDPTAGKRSELYAPAMYSNTSKSTDTPGYVEVLGKSGSTECTLGRLHTLCSISFHSDLLSAPCDLLS